MNAVSLPTFGEKRHPTRVRVVAAPELNTTCQSRRSPGATVTECVVSPPPVAVPVSVTLSGVLAPFFLSVAVTLFPTPGANSTLRYAAETVPDVGQGALMSLSTLLIPATIGAMYQVDPAPSACLEAEENSQRVRFGPLAATLSAYDRVPVLAGLPEGTHFNARRS